MLLQSPTVSVDFPLVGCLPYSQPGGGRIPGCDSLLLLIEPHAYSGHQCQKRLQRGYGSCCQITGAQSRPCALACFLMLSLCSLLQNMICPSQERRHEKGSRKTRLLLIIQRLQFPPHRCPPSALRGHFKQPFLLLSCPLTFFKIFKPMCVF